MPRFLKSRKKTIDKPSGAFVHVSTSAPTKTETSILSYSTETLDEKSSCSVNEIEKCKGQVSWLDVRGLANQDTLKNIASVFNIPNLWIEDVLNTDHRPKLEEMEECLFAVTKLPTYSKETGTVKFEQISIIVKDDKVVTFQEDASDTLVNLKNRIRSAKGRIRKKGTNYLFYSLIDLVVDRYYLVLEEVGRRIEKSEREIESSATTEQIRELMGLRQELLYLRKSALPLKESIQQIYNLPAISDDSEMTLYFRDTLDHAAQVVEVVESYRDMSAGLIQLVQSLQGQRMNEIMTFLTIFSAIFIPLTFIAGIYGMNFEVIPELKWKSGYFIALGFMGTIALGMILLFKKKKWL